MSRDILAADPTLTKGFYNPHELSYIYMELTWSKIDRGVTILTFLTELRWYNLLIWASD